jgi:fatty acid desaturase
MRVWRLSSLELAAAATTAGAEVTAAPARHGARVEVPTLLLIVATYLAWFSLTAAYGHVPLIVLAPLITAVLTLHSSIQHEIVHGHPTGWRAVNRLLAIVPLSLWLPYERYRELHHLHHRDARLTDPIDDPESFYWTAAELKRLGPIKRTLLTAQQTLAGRVLIGSIWRIGIFWTGELRGLRAREPALARVWLEHLLWCVPVILWVQLFCGMPLWLYFVAMVIPANGLLSIRSFAEHRARPEVPERIALVEDSWILGPLFLFNNLHALHHEAPSVPWYQYPARYRAERARLIRENGGLVYRTYFSVARRYLWRAHDQLQHPTDRVRPAPAPRA